MDALARTPVGATGLMQLRWGRALLVVNSLVIVLASIAVWQNYTVHRDSAFATTQNTARLLSHDLQASFDQIDLALLTLKGEFEQRRDANWSDIGALAERQAHQLKRLPSLSFFRVADATGTIVAGSAMPLSTDFKVSERGYFTRHRDDPAAGLFVSNAFMGVLNKKWSVAFSRRLNHANGEFAGVVYTLISLGALQDQFASLSLGPDSAISLYSSQISEITAIARFPALETIGITPGDRYIDDDWRERLIANPQNGSCTAAGRDGLMRYLSYDRLGSYPFYIVIGLSRVQALKQWWLETAVTSLLAAIILVTSTFVALSWRRIDKDSRSIIDLQTAALDHHREQLKLAMDGADLGYWTVDMPSGDAEPDAKARSILGIPPDEPVRDNRCVRAVHPEDRVIVSQAVKRTVERGDKFDVRVRVIHPDQSVHWIHSVGQVLPGGQTMIGIVRDITAEVDDLDDIMTAKLRLETALEEKAASERELRVLTLSLEQRVEDEIGRREAAQQRLSHAQRLEAIGQLAGGIAHDFNNVIQVVQGCAEMIETTHVGDEATHRLAKLILEAASRGGTVTRRLLAFARHSELSAADVDVGELLGSLMELLDHALGSGITIGLDLPDNLPKLRADKEQLETVLVNIAVNARDAMDGHGTISLAATTVMIADGDAGPPGLKPGSYLRITASDTGPGMPPEVLARACEPFFTTKPPGKGTGLGLAMAKGFTEQSGGALEIETSAGRGTSVTLWFPASTAAAARAPQAGEPPAPAAAPAATVLIVDDNPLVLDTLARQITRLGFAARRATSAAAALELIDDAVDLVVTDFSMPGMDGMSLIERLHAERPRLPTILLTGYAGQPLQDTPSELFCVLRKPATAAQLRVQIEFMLRSAKPAV